MVLDMTFSPSRTVSSSTQMLEELVRKHEDHRDKKYTTILKLQAAL